MLAMAQVERERDTQLLGETWGEARTRGNEQEINSGDDE